MLGSNRDLVLLLAALALAEAFSQNATLPVAFSANDSAKFGSGDCHGATALRLERNGYQIIPSVRKESERESALSV